MSLLDIMDSRLAIGSWDYKRTRRSTKKKKINEDTTEKKIEITWNNKQVTKRKKHKRSKWSENE